MSRQKKNKNVQEKKQIEVDMVHDKSSPEGSALIDECTEIQVNAESLENLETELDRVRLELERAKIELAEKQKEIKISPRREIDEEEMVFVRKQKDRSQASEGLKSKIEQQKLRDNEKITGRFMNRRAPGNSVKLTYMKYADDPVKWYVFEDGKVYTIPRGFVDQINEHYYKPGFIKSEGNLDPNRPSSTIEEVDTSNKIYAFVPVNF